MADVGGPSSLFWLAHPARVWAPCRLLGIDGGTASLAAEDGEVLSCPAERVHTLEHVHEQQLEGVEDVCALGAVSEAALLHTVRTRYTAHLMYTRVSRILIALNPFCPQSIYSSEFLDRYASATDSLDLPPHIFGTGHDAMRGIQDGARDQAIVISGESGAGKTESAKLLLSYVAAAVRSGGSARGDGHELGVEEKVMQTNPVLEAFGNAMTVRNNNSSRFGKWLDMRLSPSSGMRGCKITSYLLEVTRVCTQAEGERGFHIFFQLLQGARASPLVQRLELGQWDQYSYLRGSCQAAPGIDDAACFQETCASLGSLGFCEAEQVQVFRLIAAVLTLGNVEFLCSSLDELSLKDSAPVRRVAELLHVDGAVLERCMLWRKVVAGRDVTETSLREEQAKAVRDGLSRMLYRFLFEWLIQRINEQLHSGSQSSPCASPARQPEGDSEYMASDVSIDHLLGILDISGFESFQTNSLEQLLINLSNEHLQLQFNEHVFKAELEDCAKEGVVLGESISYADNSDCVALVDGKGGILDMLDEDLMMPKASDETFSRKVLQGHAKHDRIVAPKFAGKAMFGVRHYAGEVSYTCDGFLEKNADRLPSGEAVGLLSASRLPVVCAVGQLLGEQASAQSSAGGSRGAQGQRKSATARFRTSLRSLMQKIGRADTHYVRCIKPNSEKAPDCFTASTVREQLLYSGVLEAVRIRQQGYSSRLPFRAFALRYRCAVTVRLPRSSQPPGVLCAAAGGGGDRVAAHELVLHLRDRLGLGEAQFVLGNTKVFIKAAAMASLESARTLAYLAAIGHVQNAIRAATVRRRVAAARPLLAEIGGWLQLRCPGATWKGNARPIILLRYDSLQAAEEELLHVARLCDMAEALPLRFGVERRAGVARQRLRDEVLALERLQRCLRGAVVRRRLAHAREQLSEVRGWLDRCCPEPAALRRRGIELLRRFQEFEAAERELACVRSSLERMESSPLRPGTVARAGLARERLQAELGAVRGAQRFLRGALVRARLAKARSLLTEIRDWESRRCAGRDWRRGGLADALVRQFETFEQAEQELSLVTSCTGALADWAAAVGVVRRAEAASERLWSEVQAVRLLQRALRGAVARRRVARAKEVVLELRAWVDRMCAGAQAPQNGAPPTALLQSLQTLEKAELELSRSAECLERAAALPFDFGGLVKRTWLVKGRLQQEIEVLHAVRDQLRAASLDTAAMREALRRAGELALPRSLEDMAALADRVERVEAQVPVAESLRAVVASDDFATVPAALRLAEQAGVLRDPLAWLPELGGPGLLAEVAALVDAKEAQARRQASDAARDATEALERQRVAEAAAAGFAEAARVARSALPPGFVDGRAGGVAGQEDEAEEPGSAGAARPRARAAAAVGHGRGMAAIGKAVARLTEEREGLRQAMQEALMDALGREEALFAECEALRRGGSVVGSKDFDVAAAAARSRLVAENVRLQADLVSARVAAREALQAAGLSAAP